MTIEISSNYGFDRNWTLVVDNQRKVLFKGIRNGTNLCCTTNW
jgi:hypothetical protein